MMISCSSTLQSTPGSDGTCCVVFSVMDQAFTAYDACVVEPWVSSIVRDRSCQDTVISPCRAQFVVVVHQLTDFMGWLVGMHLVFTQGIILLFMLASRLVVTAALVQKAVPCNPPAGPVHAYIPDSFSDMV
jgi:hypothetical protein